MLDCTYVQSLYQKSLLISVCFCKISVAIRKYLRISLIFVYYDKLTHLIYLHFSLLPYTCAGLYGYYFFSSICTVFFPWLYGYNLFSFICTVFFPWLYGYHFFSFICTVFSRGCTVIISFPLFAPYFFRDCTVIISFLLFAPYFFRDCTVIIPFLLFAPYFCDDCTVIIPFLLFAPYFCDDCTVIIHISFLCIVFLSNISSNIKNKRIVEINDSLIIHECRRPESNRYGYHYPRDFKSRASASSATAAYIILWGL